MTTFDRWPIPWGEGHGVQGQICDILRPQQLWIASCPSGHTDSRTLYTYIWGGGGGGSDIRSMSSIWPICKCRCPPLAISLHPYTYTYEGLERLENGAPLGPGCGGRAEESHLLCIKLHRDLAYKRPRRPQSLVFVDRHRFDADTDPDLAPLQSDRNLWPMVYRTPEFHFEPPSLHCERPRPSTALFWASKAFEFRF